MQTGVQRGESHAMLGPMIETAASRSAAASTQVRVRVDLFAQTLATLSFGWMMMNLLHGWSMSLSIQAGIIMVCAVLWTLFGMLGVLAIRKAALRAMR